MLPKKEASTIKINRRLKTEANRPRHKKKIATPGPLTSYEGIACTVCVNNVFGVSFHYREGFNLVTWKDEEKNSSLPHKDKRQSETDARKWEKKEGNITLSHNRFILPLSNNYNPLSLFVVFG